MTEVTPPAPDGHRGLKSPAISFEFFPPKTEEMERNLWETIKRLAPLAPNFVSVTYGAGGSTRERTHSTIARILSETSLTPAAHLTCVDAPCSDVDDVVARYHEVGVRHIVALRGDPASGLGTAYTAHPGGYKTSADLVASIKKRYPDIEVSVSAYPEKHPESPSFDADIDMLKAKVDAGATRAITQFFFDNDLYFRCRISSKPRISPTAPAPAYRTGWRRNSRGSTTIPTPASWWPPPSRPARCRSSPSTASTPFTSTP
jgi:methylenetetrahydrofolate reductase (NADPH)